MLVSGVSRAGLIPGPGKTTGCYAEWDVAGATTTSAHQKCVDGDPTCDTDGQCQGTCTFFIQLCVNQTNVATCKPSAFKTSAKRPLRVKGNLLPLPVTTGNEAACGDAMPIVVPLKGKSGHRKLEVTANTTGSPPREKSFLFLTCKRRTDTCPAPGSTTTTTTAASTTTTTTH